MAYDISFRRGVESAFETLESEAVSRIQKKLDQVATNEFRTATDWGYSNWDGQSSGKYDWGSHRVFVDVDETLERIVVYEARHRENLYR